MIVRQFLVLLGLWCIGPTAGAAREQLVLQAEETAGVTRVEIAVNDIPFSLEKPEARIIDFVTPYRFKSINLAQLITGGAARRVANARIVPDEEATRLRMVLNCNCGFDFSVSSGVLSVRIKDPVKSEARAAHPEIEGAPAKTATATPRKPAPETAPAPLARPKISSGPSLAAVAPAPQGDQNSPVEPFVFPPADEANKAEEVVLARDHLMHQLSRAAEQGLIQFVSDAAAAQSPEPETAPAKVPRAKPDEAAPALLAPTNVDAPVEVSTADASADPPPAPIEIPLRARTAVDKNFSPDRAETRIAIAFCIDPARLDAPAWALPGNFLETKLDLRAKLLDEFDQPKPDVATKLARHLVLNGFGAEAREILRVYGEVIEDREVLSDLAGLVDLKAPDPRGHIAKTAPCHPEAALWRAIAGLPDGEGAIAQPASPAEMAIRERQMLDAFARLPAATRRILGARLMNNLIAKGKLDLAGQLNLILLRAPSIADEALSLARARLFGETGHLEAAEELYQSLSQSSRPEAQQALILLLDSRINRDAGGSFELTSALGDAAFSARGTPSELPLKVAEIRSRTLTDGASGALQALQAAIERSGGASKLLQDVGHAALEMLAPVDGDVIDYAKAVMALQPHISAGPSGDPARRRVASTLTEAGLPNLALTYLEPALGRPSKPTVLAVARTLLALGAAEDAIAALEGQTGPDAIPLKVEALERLGRHDAAHLLSAEMAQDDGAARSARALRAGEWDDASAAGETPQRLLAAFMASKRTLDDGENEPNAGSDFLTPPQVDRETTLESVRSVVEASRSARSIIEKALEDG